MTEQGKIINPHAMLLPYQREFIDNKSRFKLFLASRQIGKSFVLAFEAVRDCVLNQKSSWLSVSRGERQSQEWLKKARDLALIWCAYASQNGLHIKYASNQSEIRFSNGSRILALPSKSDTIRGYSANVILDEFAYHERPNELWEAIFPSISNELNAKYKLIIASTVAGRVNKFWQLWEQDNSFWKLKVDIHRAIREGLPMNASELKASIGDDDAFRQEYECVPMSDSSAIATVERIKEAQRRGMNFATDDMPPEQLNDPNRKFYVGIDIGRKHDLTAVWVLEKCASGFLKTCMLLELKGADFATQREAIKEILKGKSVKKACIDATGVGTQLGEELSQMFGNAKVEQCTFSMQFKNELWTAYSRAFQDDKLAIISDSKERAITQDLSAIQRHFTLAGNVTYSAPTNADGHSDRATALALAIRATGEYKGKSNGTIVSKQQSCVSKWSQINWKKIPTLRGHRFI